MERNFERLLLISVGTSIYTSLSWKPEAFPQEPAYRKWVEVRSDLILNPKSRSRNLQIEATVTAALTEENDRAMAELLDTNQWEVKASRYSAELTTLMRLARIRAAEASINPECWMQASEVVCISDRVIQKGQSRIAALHLTEEIRQWAGMNLASFSRPITFDGMESSEPKLFTTAQFRALKLAQDYSLEFLKNGKEVFYIASGGFKFTACLAGLLLPPSTSHAKLYLVYQHESNPALIIVNADDQFVHRLDQGNGEATAPAWRAL